MQIYMLFKDWRVSYSLAHRFFPYKKDLVYNCIIAPAIDFNSGANYISSTDQWKL